MPTTNGTPNKKNDGGKKDTKKGKREYPLTNIKRPGEHDVLQGRGGLANNFCGNILYRGTVEGRKAEYVQSQRANKTALSWELVRWWRSLDPPGRFLKQDEEGLWHDIGDKKARRKTSQLFREEPKPARASVVGSSSAHGNVPDQHGDATDASEDTADDTVTSSEMETNTETSGNSMRVPRKPSPRLARRKTVPARKNSTTSKQQIQKAPNKAKAPHKTKGQANLKPAPQYAAAPAKLPSSDSTSNTTQTTTSRNEHYGNQCMSSGTEFAPEEEEGMDDRKPPALPVESAAFGGGDDGRYESWGTSMDRLLDSEFVLGDLGDLGLDTYNTLGASGVALEPLMGFQQPTGTGTGTQQPTTEDPMDVDPLGEEDDSGRLLLKHGLLI